jgi:hypothetical protein
VAGRDAQGATFDAILAGDAFDSAELLVLTLADGVTVIHLSDVPVTVGAQPYVPDVREPGEPKFSQGGNTDGMRIGLDNTDGAYSATDAAGDSLLEGATYRYLRAVSYPGANDWHADEIDDGRLRDVEIDQGLAHFSLISDMSDPSRVVSGEVVTLEELTVVSEVVTTGGGDRVGGGGGSNGWRRDNYFDYLRDRQLGRENRAY